MNLPELKPIESSKIKAVGYDLKERALFCQFKSDCSIWRYAPVSKEEFEDMMASESIGIAHGVLVRKLKRVNQLVQVDNHWEIKD